MRVVMSTTLETTAEKAWSEVQTSRLLRHIAWPLLTFKPIGTDRLPEVWKDGTYPVTLSAFGIIPLGKQRIVTTRPAVGPDRYQIRDNGVGDLAKSWDHMITIEPRGMEWCRYTDEIEVKAGLLTPFVWVFALLFYAHRQRRWRGLVARHFNYQG